MNKSALLLAATLGGFAAASVATTGKGVQRVAPGTPTARRMTAAKGTADRVGATVSVSEHNRLCDEKRKADLAARAARRAAKEKA